MKSVLWNLDSSACDYPDKVREIYYKNYELLRNEFSIWIDSLSKNFKNNIDWWLLFPSSRNPNFSNLFHYICIIETIKKLVKKKRALKVITKSACLHKLIKKNNLKNILINADNSHKKEKKFYFHFFKSFIFQFYTYFFINLFIKKKNITANVFISTYPNNKIKKIERLFQFKDRKYENNYLFVPSFLLSSRVFFLIKLLFKLEKKNYIFKEHYLHLSDLIYAFKFIWRIKKFNKKYKKFKGSDLSNIIYSEISNLKNFNTYVIGILNYKFVEKLKINNIKVKKTLCWYENHELKGWNIGFRKYFPQSKTYGYQGFSPLISLMNSIPTNYEEKSKVIPKTIILTSKKYKKVICEFNKNIKIKIGPSLVFRDIFKKFKKNNKIKYLVILNEIKSANVEILKWLDYISSKGVKSLFIIKIPKILNMNLSINKYRNNKNFCFTNKNLPDLFKNSDYAITGGVGLSSISLEAIAYKCHLLVPVVDPLDRIYFDRLNIYKKFYKIFLKKKDFLYFFLNNKKIKKTYISNNKYDTFRKLYFSRANEKIFY
jgi:hypothetical protein